MAIVLDVVETPCLAVVYQWSPELPFSESEFCKMINEVNETLKEKCHNVNAKGWHSIPMPLVGPWIKNSDRNKGHKINLQALADECTRLNLVHGKVATFVVNTENQIVPTGLIHKRQVNHVKYCITVVPKIDHDAMVIDESCAKADKEYLGAEAIAVR